MRPYVRRNKTDRADAEAILEAVRSGEMPSVPVKRIEQQALVALHRVREQWMTTRTARINTLRGILREHGLLLPAGARAALQAVPTILEDAETALPLHLRTVLASVHEEVRAIEARIADLERELRALAEADPVVTRLRTIPGIGLLTATALVGSVGHIHAFRRARQFASWLGLTPARALQRARRRLGGISKQGDVYLRCLLTHGARAVLRHGPPPRGARRNRSRACISGRSPCATGAATTKRRLPWPINSAASSGPSGTRTCRSRMPRRGVTTARRLSTRDAQRVT